MEHPFWHQLKITVPHVVHEVDVNDIQHKYKGGAISHVNCGQHRDCKEREIDDVFAKRMDDRCNTETY